METDTLLLVSEPKLGVPFGLALCAGLTLIAAAALLRPWPPRAPRAIAFAAVLALCLGAMWLLLCKRELQIDPAREEVREQVAALGLGHTRRWAFARIQAVVAERARAPDAGTPRFSVYLRTAGETIALSDHADAFEAEAVVHRVAAATRWPALRRGYRLDTTLPVGPTERFQLPDGRVGTQIDLQAAVRVVEAPGAESPIVTP